MDTDRPDFSKRLFCVEYPGRVNNVGRMLQTLGGVETIATVSSGETCPMFCNINLPAGVRNKEPQSGTEVPTGWRLLQTRVRRQTRDDRAPYQGESEEKNSWREHAMLFKRFRKITFYDLRDISRRSGRHYIQIWKWVTMISIQYLKKHSCYICCFLFLNFYLSNLPLFTN